MQTIKHRCKKLKINENTEGKTSHVHGSEDLILLRSVGLVKKCFQYLSKNKSYIFHFLQELYWTMYSPFCSTTFCHFSINFIIPSSQNFLSFLSKELFQVPFTIFQGIEFFPLKEFCKDQNKWKSEDVMSGEYSSNPNVQGLVSMADESELPSQAVTVFAWSLKKHAVLHYPNGRLCVLLLNSGHFFSSAAFSWSNWEQFLLEFIIWFSRRSS